MTNSTKWKVIKEDYEQYISNTCAACSKDFKNNWTRYNLSGNYCPACVTKTNNLEKKQREIGTKEHHIKDQVKTGFDVSVLTDELNVLKKELQDIKDSFVFYAEDINLLLSRI